MRSTGVSAAFRVVMKRFAAKRALRVAVMSLCRSIRATPDHQLFETLKVILGNGVAGAIFDAAGSADMELAVDAQSAIEKIYGRLASRVVNSVEARRALVEFLAHGCD